MDKKKTKIESFHFLFSFASYIQKWKIFPEIIQYDCLFIYSQEHFSPKKGERNIAYKDFFFFLVNDKFSSNYISFC